jgi:hypothetical protein
MKKNIFAILTVCAMTASLIGCTSNKSPAPTSVPQTTAQVETTAQSQPTPPASDEKPERPDKPEDFGSEKPERPDKPDLSEKPELPGMSGKPDMPELKDGELPPIAHENKNFAAPVSEDEKKEFYSDYAKEIGMGIIGKSMSFVYEEDGASFDMTISTNDKGELNVFGFSLNGNTIEMLIDNNDIYCHVKTGEDESWQHAVSADKNSEDSIVSSMGTGFVDGVIEEDSYKNTEYVKTVNIDGVEYDVVKVNYETESDEDENVKVEDSFNAYINTANGDTEKIEIEENGESTLVDLKESINVKNIIAGVSNIEETDEETLGLTFAFGIFGLMAEDGDLDFGDLDDTENAAA